MNAVSLSAAKEHLEDLLAQLGAGETVTLVDPEGSPLAVLVSVRSSGAPEVLAAAQWEARWDELAESVSQKWEDERNAVEILTEMRR